MLAKVKRWGNSFGVRLTKRDLEALDVKEGETVRLIIEKTGGEVDLSGLPVFSDPDPYASERHDEYLAEHYRSDEWRSRSGRPTGKEK